MTEISTRYDDIVSRLAALYTSHKRLPFFDDLSKNNVLYLEQGYAIQVGGCENTNRELSCRLSLERDFTVKFTRKYYALDHDVGNKTDAEQNLLEDAQTLYDDLQNNLQLSDDNGLVQSVNDDGIEFVFADERPFITIGINFTLEYFRTV